MFAIKERQERYLALLKGRKHRAKLLDGLNHDFAYDPSKATRLPAMFREIEPLTSFLAAQYVSPTCYLMADSNDLDGKELRIDVAVTELLNNHFGALMICPPKPIALYKEEDPSDLILLANEPFNFHY